MYDLIIGVDPGLTGAVAFMKPNGVLLGVHDLPVMAKGKGSSRVKNQINPSALAVLIKSEYATITKKHISDDAMISPWSSWRLTVYIERVSAMPGQGVASVFSLGDTFGSIRGVVGALGIPIEVITPQSWKKHFTLKSDKEVCRAKAIELYPEAPLNLKKHHNRSEAILIARYGCSLNMSNVVSVA